MRFSTRSLTACASRESSLSQVKAAHSGFWPVSSVFRYEIRYFGMDQPPLVPSMSVTKRSNR